MACGNQFYDCNGNLKSGVANNSTQINKTGVFLGNNMKTNIKHQTYGKPSTKLNIKTR